MNPKITGVGINTFYNANDSTTLTGTLTETVLLSVLVPAGTYTAGDLLILQALYSKIGTSGNFTHKFYASPNNPDVSVISGALLLLIRSVASSNLYIDSGGRHLYIKNASGGGSGIELGTEVATPSTGLFSEMRSSGASNVAINWNNDVYIFCTGTLSNTSDRVVQRYLKIWEY